MAQPFVADFPPTLGFEANAGQHYMIIDSYESKNAVSSVGQTSTEGMSTAPKLSSIGLYIPAGSLTTSFTGNYEGKEGAATAARTGGAFSGEGTLAEKATRFASSLGEKLTKSVLSTADSGGFISAQGLSPNNYMALVYRGPNTFRQHTFAFKFFPKNSDESETVRKIVQELRIGTLPRMSGGNGTLTDSFFKSPRHHTINFYKGGSGAGGTGRGNSQNTKLFTVGKSVITNLVLNYDPQSVVSFHGDGNPVQIDMSITFQEIELQINTKDSVGGGFDKLANQTAVNQNQSSSQTTSEQQAEQQRVAQDIQAPQAGSGIS